MTQLDGNEGIYFSQNAETSTILLSASNFSLVFVNTNNINLVSISPTLEGENTN